MSTSPPQATRSSQIDWAAEFAKLPDENRRQVPEATVPLSVFDFKNWDP